MIHPIGGVDVLADEAFEVSARGVGPPPDHVHGQDVRRDDLVEPEPELVGAGLDRLAGRRLRMVEADVDAAQHEQERRDRLAHVIVDRRSAAVDVFPPGDQVGRPVADDLLVVDLRQVDLDGLGDELGHGRPGPAQLVIVVHRRRGRVGAEHAGIRAVADVLRLGVARAEEAGEPLVDLRKLLRVGVLAFVAEEVAAGQAAAVGAVHGVAVSVAPLVRIHQPPPADLVLEPVDMPALTIELAVQSSRLATRAGLAACRRDRRRAVSADPRPGLGDVRLKTSKAWSVVRGQWSVVSARGQLPVVRCQQSKVPCRARPAWSRNRPTRHRPGHDKRGTQDATMTSR